MRGQEGGHRLRAERVAAGIDALALGLEPARRPEAGHGVVVEIAFAGVNPSDAKACLGLMPTAVFPRTPGRDFAGRIVDGPAELLGLEVWGTGGDLGITRDGSHARFLWLERGAVRRKPASLALEEAAGIGVPFVTAAVGFAEAGGIAPGSRVAVLGANGKVGQAAVQIAAWSGAQVIAVTRDRARDLAYIEAPFTHVAAGPLDETVAALRGQDGRGVDIVFNTVGAAYWEIALGALAPRGRQILIATNERTVPLDILRFYRGRHALIGIDTLKLDARESGAVLEGLAPGFESGALQPFPVPPAAIAPLADWRRVYAAVLAGARQRTVFTLADP